MLRRAARLLLRVAGWLLTPLILIAAAALGACIGLLMQNGITVRLPKLGTLPILPELSPTVGVVLTLLLALADAILVLVLWIRMLRERPGLREALDITPEGVPDTALVEKLVHPDQP